jgi:uncharacterized protein YeaO (DUF488 family)
MLARYTMYRGKRPVHDPLPAGVRQDTRKHTGHCLRPSAEAVLAYLTDPGGEHWPKFRQKYLAALAERFQREREGFDELAQLASTADVFIGCSCPTQRNPDVRHCHTVLALEFMKQKYPELNVRMPG